MIDDLIALRQDKDQFFKSSSYSPLTPEQQVKFDHLNYFDPNPALVFDLTPEEFAEKKNLQMMTSTGDTRYYLRWGRVKFEVDGQPAELTLFFAPGHDQFFLPFTDATTGTESYGAGRYLDLDRQSDGSIHLDFNVTYSPYCAYGDGWSCPVPPPENRLKVAIRAGEKTPTGEWVEKDSAAL